MNNRPPVGNRNIKARSFGQTYFVIASTLIMWPTENHKLFSTQNIDIGCWFTMGHAIQIFSGRQANFFKTKRRFKLVISLTLIFSTGNRTASWSRHYHYEAHMDHRGTQGLASVVFYPMSWSTKKPSKQKGSLSENNQIHDRYQPEGHWKFFWKWIVA